jgi:hypothetical protein
VPQGYESNTTTTNNNNNLIQFFIIFVGRSVGVVRLRTNTTEFFYYFCAESTAKRPITDTAQWKQVMTL